MSCHCAMGVSQIVEWLAMVPPDRQPAVGSGDAEETECAKLLDLFPEAGRRAASFGLLALDAMHGESFCRGIEENREREQLPRRQIGQAGA